MLSKNDTAASEIEAWLHSNIDENEFNAAFRYNSGDPSLFVDIYDRDAATLFYMTWVADNGCSETPRGAI